MSLLILFSGGVSNTAPVVDAGPLVPATTLVDFTLDGTVSDDGLPSGSLTYLWTQESGPGTITFDTATAVDTLANADTAGVYVVRLTVDDGELTAFDETTVIVSDPGGGGGGDEAFFWR